MMRTSQLTLICALAVTALAGCTVKDVDAPSFSAPSSLARTIIMTADRDTLLQNGEDEAIITLRAQVPPGESENVRLRAEVYIDGVAQDFGTLSNKTPITPTTIRYRAPAASGNTQVTQTVTIGVTPYDSGDARAEVIRQVDIRLVPQGVILPINPNLVAGFTFTPASPQVAAVVSFSAANTTNGGAACGPACTYTWNFGDGTTASGMNVTHQFRTAGNNVVTLTVTDNRGSQTTSVQTVTVAPGTLPVPAFSISPSPVGANQDVFFSAEASTVIAPRRIVSYEWNFGDNSSGSGVTTTHRYRAVGTYSVVLTVTDDAGVSARATQTITVAEGLPTVTATVSGLKVGGITQLIINATPATGSTIKEFSINWGDGSPTEFSSSPTQTHVYTSAQTFTIVLTAEDSIGRKRSITVAATVAP